MSLVWKSLDEAKMVLEEKGLMSVGNRRAQ
jgi:hypothetical protein